VGGQAAFTQRWILSSLSGQIPTMAPLWVWGPQRRNPAGCLPD